MLSKEYYFGSPRLLEICYKIATLADTTKNKIFLSQSVSSNKWNLNSTLPTNFKFCNKFLKNSKWILNAVKSGLAKVRWNTCWRACNKKQHLNFVIPIVSIKRAMLYNIWAMLWFNKSITIFIRRSSTNPTTTAG